MEISGTRPSSDGYSRSAIALNRSTLWRDYNALIASISQYSMEFRAPAPWTPARTNSEFKTRLLRH